MTSTKRVWRLPDYTNEDAWQEEVFDYDVVEAPDPRFVSLVTLLVKKHIKAGLFTKLKIPPPAIYFVQGLNQDHLARYLDGTTNPAVIVLDAEGILVGASEYNVEVKDAFESTLLHEYGHAWLATRLGEPPGDDSEEEAVEAFAHRFWASRDLRATKILEQYARQVERSTR